MISSPLLTFSLAALAVAQTVGLHPASLHDPLHSQSYCTPLTQHQTVPILGSINPGSIAIPSSVNNPFTIYLSQTNSLGVVTGMPPLITSEPSLITSQPAIATFTNGEGGGIVVSTATSAGSISVRTLTSLATITSSGTGIPGGVVGGAAGAGASSSAASVSNSMASASSAAAATSTAAATSAVAVTTITTAQGSAGTSAAAAASASATGSGAAGLIKVSGGLLGLAAFVAALF